MGRAATNLSHKRKIKKITPMNEIIAPNEETTFQVV